MKFKVGDRVILIYPDDDNGLMPHYKNSVGYRTAITDIDGCDYTIDINGKPYVIPAKCLCLDRGFKQRLWQLCLDEFSGKPIEYGFVKRSEPRRLLDFIHTCVENHSKKCIGTFKVEEFLNVIKGYYSDWPPFVKLIKADDNNHLHYVIFMLIRKFWQAVNELP